MNKEIIDLLEDAKKQHNDDCILCAVKDTRINSALALLKQQPPAGEFTKDFRERISRYRKTHVLSHVPYTVGILNRGEKLCVRLDTAEAINAELLTAFKRYATHDPDCHKISRFGVDNDCTCGFDKALIKSK